MKEKKSNSEIDNTKSMKFIIPTLESVDKYTHYVDEVSRWTFYYKNSMWPRSPEKIMGNFQKGHSVLLIDEKKEELLAHGAIKWISTANPILEIGTIVVNPKYGGLGYGTKVTEATIDHAKEKYPQLLQFAFCNSSSLGLFKKIGAIEAKVNDLPSEVWDGCAECPNKPKLGTDKFCCDTIVYFPVLNT
jgi:N-acetylglutamate synthase-like GNAT family acetyltransferase